MNQALSWLRTKGDDFEDAPDFESYGFGDSVTPFGKDANSQDMSDALNWLRGKRDADVDTETFEKLDKILSKKEGQTEEARAKEMENALAWLRSQGLDLEEDDSPVESFDTIGVVPMGLRSQEDRDADRLKALNWLREKDEGLDDYEVSGFADLDQMLPRNDSQSAEARANDMENALAWLRHNGVVTDDDDGNISFAKAGNVVVAPRSREERLRDEQGALDWIRGMGNEMDSDSVFSKLDKFVGPSKPGQDELQRAKDMENALNWFRERDIDIEGLDDPDSDDFVPAEGMSFGGRSGKDGRSRDQAAVLNWLRNQDDDTLDPSGLFKKLHGSLPKKKGQPLESRAEEIAAALVWMRDRGLASTNDDEEETFERVGSGPSIGKYSSDLRSKQYDSALDWLRSKNEDGADDDPNLFFAQLDATLPRKANQTAEDRAREMEMAMNWMREQGLDVDSEYDDPTFDKSGLFPSKTKHGDLPSRDLDKALNWIRNKDMVEDDSLLDPTGVFKKLESTLPTKKGQTAEERAKQMEQALAWMRGKGLVAEEKEIGLPGFSAADFVATNSRSQIRSEEDYENALNWLRNQGVDSEDGDVTFKKLDSMLPKRDSQSVEDRAREMQNALTWLRGGGIKIDGLEPDYASFAQEPSVDFSRRSVEERKKDLEKILNWMRKGKGKGLKKEDKYDPSGEFRQLDSLLPKKKSQTPEQRAREIEGALDWLRSGAADPDTVSTYVPSFDKTGITPIGRRTPEERATDFQSALNWIRNSGKDDDYYDPSGEFRKLDGMIPQRKGQSPEERALEIERALDWMRTKDVNDAEVEETPDLTNLGVLSVCKRSPEERAKSLDDVSTWIRHKKKDKYDPSGDFKKIDQILPKKKGQEASDRARDIESVLDWVHNHEISADSEGLPPLFKKVGQAPFSRRTPEQRARDLADTMNWIRNKGKDDSTTDPSGDFRRLDLLLARQPGQSPEDRARQIEGSLDWIRDTTVSSDTPEIQDFAILGNLPVNKRSPEERFEDLDNVLNFLRNKGSSKKEKKYDPSGDFKLLDKLLPKKKRGTEEDRARDIEGALDWMRNHGVKPGDLKPLEKFKKLGTIPVSRRTPEQRAKDLDDTMNWLRKKGKKGGKADPTGDFAKLDAILPRKKDQSPELRARQIEGALDWVRTCDVTSSSPPESEKPMVAPSIAFARRTPEERKKSVDDVLTWLRNGMKDSDDSSGDFRRLNGLLPQRKGTQSDEDRAREIEGAMDWLRNNSVAPSCVKEEMDLTNAGFVPVSQRTPEQRAKDLSDCMNWLRNKGTDGSGYDLTGDFKKLDDALKAVPGQRLEDRARQIEGALDWARNASVNPPPAPSKDTLSLVANIPVSRRSPEERTQEISEIVNWIRGGRKSKGVVSDDFRKVDQVLPRLIGQSPESRAHAIESALDWMRQNNVSPEDESALDKFRKVETAPMAARTPEQRSKDLEDAITWLRAGAKPDENLDPTGVFHLLDAALPRKSRESPDDRARQMEGRLDWARQYVNKANSLDVPATFGNQPSVLISRRSPEQRQKQLDAILEWTRNKNDKSLDPTGEFQKMDQKMPTKTNQTPEARARDIEGALDWMRNSGLTGITIENINRFSKSGSFPVSRRTPEQRQMDLQDCLNWARNKGDSGDVLDPTGEFLKLDSMLPQRGQKPEGRAREIESALDWLRDRSVGAAHGAPLANFDKIAQIPQLPRTPENRKDTLEQALSWLRNGKKKSGDPTGDFKKLDKLLPKRKGQTQEDRAREIENVFDWLRSEGIKSTDDNAVEAFVKRGGVPMTRRTPEQRAKDQKEALNWLRNKGVADDVYDPTGEFRVVDSLLPMHPQQTQEARSIQIEKTLDWVRQHQIPMDLHAQHTMPKQFESLSVDAQSPQDRINCLNNALTWIRNGKRDKDDTNGDFKKVDQLLPTKRGQSPEDRARDIEGALDWMRNNGVSVDDDDALSKFKKMGGVPMSRRTPEQRAKDLDDTLNWLRNKGKNDGLDDPTGEFRKLDAMLPVKRGQTPGERAREIESALDWLRNPGASVFFDPEVPGPWFFYQGLFTRFTSHT
eukprot:Nitzschia sp. Nitz4//scaffold279_size24496//752//7097//NITZ4_008380-RA/size24496-exonerate_est2genome-gene-0.13-mRNA-1//-1//CDS//3329545391//9065//frame0